ncbi:hypothetical protein MKX03_017678 [Papaver bracteatum]|nr:hypothetical protein MKX03_017678 [Papaver bracteatum]
MAFLVLLWIVSYLISVNYSSVCLGQTRFNVAHFGAVGDGHNIDTGAFLEAWKSTCLGTGETIMVIPKGKIFLVGKITFSGPCKATSILVKIAGTIIAPHLPRDWGLSGDIYTWILFQNVNGLTVAGGGTIDGRGDKWWEHSCSNVYHPYRPRCSKIQPAAINFWGTSDGHLKGITVKNSPMFHITLIGLNNFEVYNIKVKSPKDSPNTDGIHTQDVQHVTISNSHFMSGDDCVSVGEGSSYVYIRNSHCGPGHGISIGSLGEKGSTAYVNEIHVENIHFFGTATGVRIKTWQDGRGECRSVTFKNRNFTNVQNPILIDQHYFAKSPKETSAVRIRDITYENLRGTVDGSTPSAIALGCSTIVPCTGLRFKDISFRPVNPAIRLLSTCTNAKGTVIGSIYPPLNCLRSG